MSAPGLGLNSQLGNIEEETFSKLFVQNCSSVPGFSINILADCGPIIRTDRGCHTVTSRVDDAKSM